MSFNCFGLYLLNLFVWELTLSTHLIKLCINYKKYIYKLSNRYVRDETLVVEPNRKNKEGSNTSNSGPAVIFEICIHASLSVLYEIKTASYSCQITRMSELHFYPLKPGSNFTSIPHFEWVIYLPLSFKI